MFRKLGLVPIVAAAALVAAGCKEKPAEAPAGYGNAAEANAVDANAAQSNAAQASTAQANTVQANTTQANASYGGGSGGAPTGAACAGIVGTQCASPNDFCKLPEGQCKFPDAQGICTTKPNFCTKDYRPVCGCDGKTYPNKCAADREGVSVQSKGECPKPKA